MKNRITPIDRQKGVVLIISLIMLLLLTLIGLTGSQVTSLEEKMAGNAQDQNIAFQAAESALIEAEKFILDKSLASYDGEKGLLDRSDSDSLDSEPGYFDRSTWTDENSTPTKAGFGENFSNNSSKSILDPRFVIVKLPQIGSGVDARTPFKITARAQGLSPGTQIILQEYFERTH